MSTRPDATANDRPAIGRRVRTRRPTRTRLKVCCISSMGEAVAAVRAGADALGLVGAMPSGPGVIDDGLAAEIAAATPPPVATFLLTSQDKATAIAEHVARVRPTAVQVVRHIDPAESGRLRSLLPATRIVQVVHVEDDSAVGLADRYGAHADALLLDSGRPSTDELGGTGRTHDWGTSRAIVERSSIPVFLAGGITPANVGEAIRRVAPFGIDLCSSVRTDGRLDAGKLTALTEAIGAAHA